ncbi:hypothetical protein ACFL6N_03515 [Thermodesulfobacteriota bacterium]
MMKDLTVQLLCLFMLCLYPVVSPAQAESTLTMAYMADAEPINWQENGIARGIEPEIVQYVCDRLGIKVLHEFYPYVDYDSYHVYTVEH